MEPSRFWIQLSLTLPASRLLSAEAALFQAGAQSVAVEDEGFEPWFEGQPGETSPWRRVRLTALFDDARSQGAILAALQECVAWEDMATLVFDRLEDRDWGRAWMERWKPRRFGRRLWICPTWETPLEPEAINLRLDPGSAFGTGSHATTALCLEWLEAQVLTGRSLVDYGCGSGVLAIAALLLGAQRAWACDADPQALRATAENALRNGVESRLWIGPPREVPPVGADVLVANIFSHTLVALAPILVGLQRDGGRLALSGILEDQEPEVRAAYEPAYALRPGVRREGWVLLEGTKRAVGATRNAGTPRDRDVPP